MTTVRSDAELADLDVPAAVTRGLLLAAWAAPGPVHRGGHRRRAPRRGGGHRPVPLGFLARHVRTGGFAAALALPEPVIGEAGTALVRSWLQAGAATGADVGREHLFARWLAEVAALLELRRDARAGGAA